MISYCFLNIFLYSFRNIFYFVYVEIEYSVKRQSHPASRQDNESTRRYIYAVCHIPVPVA